MGAILDAREMRMPQTSERERESSGARKSLQVRRTLSDRAFFGFAFCTRRSLFFSSFATNASLSRSRSNNRYIAISLSRSLELITCGARRQ